MGGPTDDPLIEDFVFVRHVPGSHSSWGIITHGSLQVALSQVELSGTVGHHSPQVVLKCERTEPAKTANTKIEASILTSKR